MNERPALERSAVLLFGEVRQRLVVTACSPGLNRYGVHTGLPLAEAKALLGAGNGRRLKVVSFEHDADGDLARLKSLAQFLQVFSPLVGLMPVEPPDGLLLDISGCVHLYGSEEALCRAVLKELSERRLSAVACIAETLGTAWAVSRYGSGRHTIVPTGRAAVGLGPLHPAALRLPPACLDKLATLEVNTITRLRSLPRESLPSRFGPELLRRLDQALGRVPESFTTERLAEPVSATWASEEALNDLTYLEKLWEKLLGEVLAKLAQQRLGVRELEILHVTEDKRQLRLELRLHRPAFEARYLLDLLDLQRERHPIPEGVVLIRVLVTTPGRTYPRQITLFDEPEDRAQRLLAPWLDRLISRLGSEAVGRPVLVSDPQPELSYELRSVEDCPLDLRIGPADSRLPERGAARCRPLRLLARPERLRQKSDGTRRLLWKGQEMGITNASSAERIETGWQRTEDVQRDYYRVSTDRGQFLWIFRCLTTGDWFVHGLFD